MNNRYVQQFKKGALEMILLALITEKETYGYEIIAKLNQGGAAVLRVRQGRHGLPHLIPLGGIWANRKPSRAIRRQRREQKILFDHAKRTRNPARAHGFLAKIRSLRRRIFA